MGEPRVNRNLIYEFDPLEDGRWPEFVNCHGAATVFHTREWLEALWRTYGYRPCVLTTCPPGVQLTNGLVFCRVQSWLTGNRLVSVPFSDHCTPLVEHDGQTETLVAQLKADCGREDRKYVEIRPTSGIVAIDGLAEASTFCLHRLNLRPALGYLFRRFHPSCIRRRIAHAEKAGLVYEEGTSERLLQSFYGLAILTRRRQHLPPQPLTWFRNLIACMGGKLKIRLASHQNEPIAAILTLQHNGTMTFKYGFSDKRFHKLAGVPLLLWKAIQDAKNSGLVEFDFGRTEWGNQGLLRFKDRWGAERSPLTYLRFPAGQPSWYDGAFRSRIAEPIFAAAPDRVCILAANLLYRHMA